MTCLERLGRQVPLAVGKQLADAAADNHEPSGTSLCSLPEDMEAGCWSLLRISGYGLRGILQNSVRHKMTEREAFVTVIL